MASKLNVFVLPNRQHRGLRVDAVEINAGSTTHFTVYYDDSLGQRGNNLAQSVLAHCENDYIWLQQWFGGVSPADMPFNVHIVPGSSGGGHSSCSSTTLSIDAFSGPALDLVRMVVVAEVDEVFMANQNRGWNCGDSNGEALSRVLAAHIVPAALDGFATASTWLNTNPRPDWVTNTEGSDVEPISIGCSVLFINYLRNHLGIGLQAIVQTGGATLEDTYRALTSSTNGFAPFAALLEAYFPTGTQVDLGSDDPFPLPTPVVVANASGALSAFLIGNDTALYRYDQSAPNGAWGPANSMGGTWTHPVVVAPNANGALSAFLIGTDTALYIYDQTAPSGAWGPARSVGGTWMHPGVIPTAVANQNGALSIFLIGNDTVLYRYDRSSNTWASMGGVWPGPIEVARNANGALSAFLIGNDTVLYRYDQTAPNGSWTAASSMGGTWNRPIVTVPNANGALSVFIIGNDTVLYRYDQTAPNGSWTAANSMGGTWIHPSVRPLAVANANGALSLFMIGNDTALYRYDQTAPNGAWGPAKSMGGSWPGSVTVAANANGALSAFVIGNDTALYRYDQTAPNGFWTAANSMGGQWAHPGMKPLVAANKNGALSLFMIGNDTAFYRYDQVAPNGAWGPAKSMGGTWR
jgi:hypothetical protein